MNRSMPGLPIHHQAPEFTETHVHRVSDAIQPSHPMSSPSPFAPNPSQHESFPMSQLFTWGGQSTGVSALASFLPKKSQGWSKDEYKSCMVQISMGSQSVVEFLLSQILLVVSRNTVDSWNRMLCSIETEKKKNYSNVCLLCTNLINMS